jgi:hypothetical protein
MPGPSSERNRKRRRGYTFPWPEAGLEEINPDLREDFWRAMVFHGAQSECHYSVSGSCLQLERVALNALGISSGQKGKAEALINVVSVHGRPLQPAGHECDFQRNERLQLINRNLAILVGVRLA